SGMGIAPEFLPFVFDRFRQADMTSTREYGGLGLGLAIVRQLVELHGGSVEVQSAGRGQGATFFVRLPRLKDNHAARDENPPLSPALHLSSIHQPLLGGVRVLVVDDEPDARDVVEIVLQRSGAVVESAASLSAALEVFSRFVPSIVVSDIGMRGGDGYQLIEQLRRAEAQTSRAPVQAVALTAYTRAEDRQRSLDAGFQRHVSKPINPAEFLAVIVALVAEHKTQSAGNEISE
ncbi:MAG TPA: response regulator, partial [Abditibacterium sp.]